MKKKLVFIGNSIVAGYPWSKGKSFVSQVRNALKGDVLAEDSQGVVLKQPDFAKSTGFEILNKGVNGDTTEGILNRFTRDVLVYEPDLVFILTGTNDFIYRDADPEEAFANLDLMGNLCDGAKAGCVYITPIPVDAGKAEFMWMAGCGISYPAVNRDIDRFSELIRNSGRPYLDLNRFYPEFVREKGDVDLAYMDGIHPMPEGYTFIAEKVLNFINENSNLII